MRKSIILSVFTFVLLFSTAFAQTNFNLNEQIPLDPKIKTGKLENGLTYYIRENAEPKNRAQLLLATNAGSVFEDEDQKGLAHMTEHMAFNGTKNFPKHALTEYLESIGMKFGADINAYTSFDETVYMIEVPLDKPEYIDNGLQVLVDWASNISFEDEEIVAERGIIYEEYRTGKGAQERIGQQLYPYYFYKSKYAERLPIGDTAVFMTASTDKFLRFYKDWYRTDLQAIIVVGDFDASEIEKQIIAKFSALEANPTPRAAVTPEIPEHEELLVKVATDKEQPYSLVQVIIKHPMKPLATFGDYKDKLKQILFQNIINQRFSEIMMNPDAPIGYAGNEYSHFVGNVDMYAMVGLAKGDKIKETTEVLFSELMNIKQNGFNQSELDLQKQAALKQMEKVFNEKDKLKSQNLAFEYKSHFDITKTAVPGVELEYELYKTFLPQITLEEVNALVNELLTEKNMVLTVSAPEKEGFVVPTEEELKNVVAQVKNKKFEAKNEETVQKSLLSSLPKAGKTKKSFTDNELKTTTLILSNGAKVIFKTTDFKADEILMDASSKGGYSLYSLEDNFSARFAADVVSSSGLGQLNNIEFSKYTALLNVRLNLYISAYKEGLRGNSSVNDFEKMLEMVHAYFTSPRNDKDAFDAFINQNKSFLENSSNDPQTLWKNELSTILNNNSPYVAQLTAETLNKIDYNKVLTIFKKRFNTPAEFTFVFTGNITAETAKPLLEKYIGSIKVKASGENYKNIGLKYPEGIVRKEVYKGTAPNTMVYTVFPATFENTLQEKLLLEAVSNIFTDRLLKKVREEEALTYSISSSPSLRFWPEKETGINVYYTCAPANVDSINQMILDIVHSIQTDVTEDDVIKSIEKAKRAYETKIRDNNYWLQQLVLNEEVGNKEFATAFDEAVKSLTKENIQNAALKFLNKDRYILVDLQPEK